MKYTKAWPRTQQILHLVVLGVMLATTGWEGSPACVQELHTTESESVPGKPLCPGGRQRKGWFSKGQVAQADSGFLSASRPCFLKSQWGAKYPQVTSTLLEEAHLEAAVTPEQQRGSKTPPPPRLSSEDKESGREPGSDPPRKWVKEHLPKHLQWCI
jgi:hypothetical protein